MKNFRLYIWLVFFTLCVQPLALSGEKTPRSICTPGICNSAMYVFPPLKSEKRYILWPANANFLEKMHVYKGIAKEIKQKNPQKRKD